MIYYVILSIEFEILQISYNVNFYSSFEYMNLENKNPKFSTRLVYEFMQCPF